MLAGSLTEFSIPDIFSLLAATHKTGVLNLTGSEASGRVWITNGALAHAVADVTRAPLAARLLHGGEVDLDTVEPLVRAQAAEGTQVAEVLASAGIHIDRVHQLLHDQIVDAVFDLTRWSDGTFAFDAQMGAVQGTAPAIPANEVLEAVAARIAEWDGIVAQLPSPASVLVPVSRPPLQSGGMVQLSPAQWEVFTLADGLRSVGDIIALTGQGQFVVARLLASLVADGVLAVTDRMGEQPLSQQRAAHLARLEQQLLGAGAAGVAAAANGRASQVAREAQDPASGDRGMNGHHRPSETGDPGPTGPSPAVRDQAAPEPAQDRRASDPPDDSRADDSLEGAGRADGPVAEADTADSTPHDAPLDVAELVNQGRRDPAATSAEQAKTDRADAAEQRRAREMAAMGIGPTPDSDAETATAEPARPKAESTSQGTDLLSRLIDGVKGA